MTELAITLLRLGYLALLWFFVLSVMLVLRRDIFGTRITRPGSRQRTGNAKQKRAGRAKGPTRLVVTAGPLSGTTMPLGSSPILVGRSPSCSLVLDDDYSSTRHARFFPEHGSWHVADLGSTNGTYVNDQRISATTTLTSGTPVRIGQTTIELRR